MVTARDGQYLDTCIGDTFVRYFCIDIGIDLAHHECISCIGINLAGFSFITDLSISIPGCVLALHDCLRILVIK